MLWGRIGMPGGSPGWLWGLLGMGAVGRLRPGRLMLPLTTKAIISVGSYCNLLRPLIRRLFLLVPYGYIIIKMNRITKEMTAYSKALYIRRTHHPVIVTIKDNKDFIRVLY